MPSHTLHHRLKPAIVLASFQICVCIALLGCDLSSSVSVAHKDEGSTATESWFDDRTNPSKLNFSNQTSSENAYFLPKLMGSALAIFDFNNDQRLDVLCASNGSGPNVSRTTLFTQTMDGTFADASHLIDGDVEGYWQTISVGDINNDGWVDLFFGGWHSTAIAMNRKGHFTITRNPSVFDSLSWPSASSFCDYDQDGKLDLIIGQYGEYTQDKNCRNSQGLPDFCGPKSIPPAPARLYRNITSDSADDFNFEDTTQKAGLLTHKGRALATLCADLTGDGKTDILIANDALPNSLWVNQGDSTFREEGLIRGIGVNEAGQAEGNMGIAIGDINGDGLVDVFVTHVKQEWHRLWLQVAPGYFQDTTTTHGLKNANIQSTGFGTTLTDFDNDGDLDLAIVSGGVNREARSMEATQVSPPDAFWSDYLQGNYLVENNAGTFKNQSESNANFCRIPGVYRGLACGDFDFDGRVDLLVNQINGPTKLFFNKATTDKGWIIFRLWDNSLNRDDYDAVVRLRVTPDSSELVRIGNPMSSYASIHSPWIHFGLGDATEIDRIVVRWGDQREEVFRDIAINSTKVLIKGSGSAL